MNSVRTATRVLVASVYHPIREALCQFVEADPELHLVASMPSLDALPEILERRGADVLLLDLPASTAGLTVLRDVRSGNPRIPLVCLTGRASDCVTLLEAGADAAIVKGDVLPDLIALAGHRLSA